MPVGRYHEVAVRIGKSVHDNEGLVTSIYDEIPLIVPSLQCGTEWAPLVSISHDIGHAPRSPQNFHSFPPYSEYLLHPFLPPSTGIVKGMPAFFPKKPAHNFISSRVGGLHNPLLLSKYPSSSSSEKGNGPPKRGTHSSLRQRDGLCLHADAPIQIWTP